jgi:hypothetical protein
MVTIVSLRSAMKRIVLAACGVICEDVVVVVPRLLEPRMFLAQVPAELRPDVYLHIAEHVAVSIPLGGDPLYLSVADAEKLQEYSETLTELHFTVSRHRPVEEFERESYARAS